MAGRRRQLFMARFPSFADKTCQSFVSPCLLPDCVALLLTAASTRFYTSRSLIFAFFPSRPLAPCFIVGDGAEWQIQSNWPAGRPAPALTIPLRELLSGAEESIFPLATITKQTETQRTHTHTRDTRGASWEQVKRKERKWNEEEEEEWKERKQMMECRMDAHAVSAQLLSTRIHSSPSVVSLDSTSGNLLASPFLQTCLPVCHLLLQRLWGIDLPVSISSWKTLCPTPPTDEMNRRKSMPIDAIAAWALPFAQLLSSRSVPPASVAIYPSIYLSLLVYDDGLFLLMLSHLPMKSGPSPTSFSLPAFHSSYSIRLLCVLFRYAKRRPIDRSVASINISTLEVDGRRFLLYRLVIMFPFTSCRLGLGLSATRARFDFVVPDSRSDGAGIIIADCCCSPSFFPFCLFHDPFLSLSLFRLLYLVPSCPAIPPCSFGHEPGKGRARFLARTFVRHGLSHASTDDWSVTLCLLLVHSLTHTNDPSTHPCTFFFFFLFFHHCVYMRSYLFLFLSRLCWQQQKSLAAQLAAQLAWKKRAPPDCCWVGKRHRPPSSAAYETQAIDSHAMA